MNDDGKMKEYKSFDEFYPFYLSQHQNLMCQRLHFVGTALACLFFLFFLFSGHLTWLLLMILAGYGFAWIGHLVYEKNQPVTFTYPLYGLMGDFTMFWEVLRGQRKIF
ncbi:Mpo1-like protein [Legionella lytica]|uniref:Mpo1-like protein n=1 Tax=Legionella lytica TaxID=96232 RepID=A0ABW8DAQ8_9GAMM